MKKFIDLQEATGTVSFTFGRFNPPTTGHEKLCDAVKLVDRMEFSYNNFTAIKAWDK